MTPGIEPSRGKSPLHSYKHSHSLKSLTAALCQQMPGHCLWQLHYTIKGNYFSYANHKTSYQANTAEVAAGGPQSAEYAILPPLGEREAPSGGHSFLKAPVHQPFPLLLRVGNEPPGTSAMRPGSPEPNA